LKHINWNNVVVLGGCITACVQPIDQSVVEKNDEVNYFTNISDFKGGDVGN